MMEYINLGQRDRLYIAGDVIDRGMDSIPLLQHVKREKNMVFLRGNHEEFMLCGLEDLRGNRISKIDMKMWMEHGGRTTYEQYQRLDRESKTEVEE